MSERKHIMSNHTTLAGVFNHELEAMSVHARVENGVQKHQLLHGQGHNGHCTTVVVVDNRTVITSHTFTIQQLQ